MVKKLQENPFNTDKKDVLASLLNIRQQAEGYSDNFSSEEEKAKTEWLIEYFKKQPKQKKEEKWRWIKNIIKNIKR